jgi:enamine deaminase RidA (YjgF/YER057c/UK114 family)
MSARPGSDGRAEAKPTFETHGPGARDIFVPAPWREFYEATRIPAAVRTGSLLHVTGHTGEAGDGAFPRDIEAQVRNTFRNVGLTLAEAGLDWPDVVELTSYHVGLRDQTQALLAVAAEFLRKPYPAWTAVGVSELFDPEAAVEISCVAVVGS